MFSFFQLSLLIKWVSIIIFMPNGLVQSIDIKMTGPDITIGGWMENDFDSREWHTNSSPPLGNSPYADAIVVPDSVVSLSLVCNASYPVEWRFQRSQWGFRSSYRYALRTTIISTGLDMRSFSSEISLFSRESNSLTGNYTCQKVGNPYLSQSLYIFWEGPSPPFLTLAKAYRKPPNIPFSNNSESFTLPCTVSLPSVVPSLTKEVDTTSEDVITVNGSVRYDPRVGFTMTKLPNPYGRYTCHGGDADDNYEGDGDSVTFNVINADDGPKPEFNDTTQRGAFWHINSTSKELTCCSSGSKPPKLKHVYCDHPTMCTLAKHTLHTMESAKTKEMGCSIIPLRILRSGVFRCVGLGVDIVREYFYPFPEDLQGYWRGKGGKGKGRRQNERNKNDSNTSAVNQTIVDEPYFDWYQADRTKMMKVTKLNDAVYVGQNRTFSCRVSHYYYAQGLVWGINYKNETIQFFNGREAEKHKPRNMRGGIRHFDIVVGKNQQFLDLTITPDLQNITCYAPIWNSTEWGKKTIPNLVVKMPTAPKLTGKSHKEYSWYLNETKKSLECEFSGEPMPKVLWKRGNESFTLNTNTTNGTSTAFFPRVNLDTEALYECVISNEAGTVSKTFRVTVVQSTSAAISAILILSLIGLIVISIVAGFMYKYLKSQSNVISHLANLAFKDVTSTHVGDSSNSNSTNTTATMRSTVSVDNNRAILPPLSSPSAPLSNSSSNDQFGKSNGGNGFIFDYNNTHSNPPEEVCQHESTGSPQPPLSSFSSYHKF